MSDRAKPTTGNEFGPCAICGKTAMPKFGEFLCSEHGSMKYAEQAKEA